MNGRERLVRAAMAALIVAVLAGAIAYARSGTQRHVVRVGSLYPTEGAQTLGATEEQRGVRLAAEWANAHGGVRGVPIELVERSVARPEAVPAAVRSLEKDGVGLIVGSHGSAVSAAAADVASEDKVVMFETGAVGEIGSHAAPGVSFFRLAPMGANLGQAAIAFARDQAAPARGHSGPLRYAVANVDDPYGRAVAAGALDEIGHSAGELVAHEAYAAQGVGYDALAARIGAAHPDVLFVAAYLDDGVSLRHAIVRAGVPLVVNIGTSSSYCHPVFGDRLGAEAVGLFASDKPDAAHVNAGALRPEARAALAWASATYRARYQDDMSAPALSGFSNAFALFVHVLPISSSMSPADVAKAALTAKLPEGSLANGGGLDLQAPGSVDPGANRAAAGVIWEWVAPRTRAVVWPASLATQGIVADPPTS